MIDWFIYHDKPFYDGLNFENSNLIYNLFKWDIIYLCTHENILKIYLLQLMISCPMTTCFQASSLYF